MCLQSSSHSLMQAGDIIKVFKNDDVPCDLVILSTNTCTSSDPCFITTTNIDGETDIKNRLPLQVSARLSIPEFLNESPLIYCESENANTSSFDGIIRLSSGASEHIGIGSVILRGCRVVFTSKSVLVYLSIDWVIGCAIAVGSNTKIEFSTRNRPVKKESHTLQLLNQCNIYLIALLLFICTVSLFFGCQLQVSSVMSTLWDQKPHGNIDVNHDNLILHFIQTFFVYFQLCYQIVPASLYVCVEIAYGWILAD